MIRFAIIIATILLSFSSVAAKSQGIPGGEKQPEPLIIAHSATYPPFSYLDELGQPRGYLIDTWKAFGNANGVKVVFDLGTWQHSLDAVRSGTADIHGGLFYNEDRDGFLDFGPTIMEVKTCLFTHPEAGQNAPAGVVKGDYTESYLRETAPDRELVQFADSVTMIEAAEAEIIAAFASDRPTATYLMRKRKIQQTFVETETLYSKPLRTAVNEGESEQLRFIKAGWDKVDVSVRNHIDSKWFLRESGMSAWIPKLAVTAFLLLVAAVLLRRLI